MTSEIVYTGPGFVSLLTLVFIAAKLWGKISWSWLWVFCPLWISALIVSLICIIMLIITLIIGGLK